MKNIFVAISIIFIVAACATTPNPFSQWYTEYYDGYVTPTDSVEVIKPGYENVVATRNELYTQGYVLIGETSFNGDYKGESFAVEHAKSVGADLVVLASKFTDSTTQTAGFVTNGLILPVTSSQRRYDQGALYFSKKLEKPRYGFYHEPLSSEEKQRNEINYGLKIYVIVNNSPMQSAGAVPGDILLEVNGRKIISVQDITTDGDSVVIKVLRNGEIKELPVRFFDY